VTERLVRAGFVVAAPTFPLTSAGAPGGPSAVDYVNQPGDVSFVITKVLALVRRKDALATTIDSGSIGAIGNSLGAVTTLCSANGCCKGARIDAAVALWGAEFPFPRGDYFSEPTPPLLLVHGTADKRLPHMGSGLPAGALAKGLPDAQGRAAQSVPRTMARPHDAFRDRLPRALPQAASASQVPGRGVGVLRSPRR